MPDWSLFVMQLPALILGALLTFLFGIGRDRLLASRSFVRAAVEKRNEKRVEKLERISNVCSSLKQKANLILQCGGGYVEMAKSTTAEIRNLQDELEVLTRFYAGSVIPYRIRAEKAMAAFEVTYASFFEDASEKRSFEKVVSAYIDLIDIIDSLSNAAMCEAQRHLDPSDDRSWIEKAVAVYRIENHWGARPLSSYFETTKA